MKKITLLFFLTFVFSGWTYYIDHEGGIEGNVPEGTNYYSTGENSNVFFSNDKIAAGWATGANSSPLGSMQMRADFKDNTDGWSTRAIKQFTRTLVPGETIYIHMDFLPDTGFSWSTKGGENVVKGIRVGKYQNSTGKGRVGGYMGYARAWFDDEFAYDSNENGGDHVLALYKHTDQLTGIETNKWNSLDVSFGATLEPGATVTMTLNGTTRTTLNQETYNTGTNTWRDLFVWSYWNNRVPKDQSMYTDNVYISNEQSYYTYIGQSGSPAPDTTDPLIENIDPADGTTGVNKDSKVMTFQLSDGESGVLTSSLRASFNGVDVTGDLGFSGNLSSSIAYLTLSGLSLSDSTAYAWAIGSLEDNAGNIIDATISGNLTTSSAAAAAAFGASDNGASGTGNSGGYSYKASEYWYPTVSDGGDVKLALNTGDHNTGEEYAKSVNVYTNMNVVGDFKSPENLTTNLYADAIFMFNIIDQDNYHMYVASNDSSIAGFWVQENGVNTQLTTTGEAIITDNNDKTFQQKVNTSTGNMEMYFGGVLKDTLTNVAITSSSYALGSLNDQVYFDDVVASSQTVTQTQSGPFFEGMRGA